MNSPLPIGQAAHYAERIAAWLTPHCDRLAVAGSVRRERPYCNDIDLVVIPKPTITSKDLFGAPEAATIGNPLFQFLERYVDSGNGAQWVTGRQLDAVNYILQLPKCQLDIFVATEANWGSKLVQRTGSKDHNIWIASRAQQLGLEWKLDTGLILRGAVRLTVVASRTEEEFYAALGMRFVPPPQREVDNLRNYIISVNSVSSVA